MQEQQKQKRQTLLKQFPSVYWISIFYEFVERGAYYGVMSILSVYLVASFQDGGLGFSKTQAGEIAGTIQPIIYALPIFCGALADRFGYRKTLSIAFLLLGIGYLAASQVSSFAGVFVAMIIMSIGAGAFKPVISGTIARVTDEKTSALGFGIFYWSINLGAFLFPLFIVPWMREEFGWNYVFIASGAAILLMLIPNIFVYKEPPKPKSSKSVPQILAEAVGVLKDYKFILLILIYSGFWILYFQMFQTVLWYITEYANITPIERAVSSAIGVFGIRCDFKLNPEYITVINAGVIIALQLIISNVTKTTKALPTMITGISLGTLAMTAIAISALYAQNVATLEISASALKGSGVTAAFMQLQEYVFHPASAFHAWALIIGVILFSIGEMTAHPKFISYVGLIAPEDKVATYMGYSFLYGVIGSGLGCRIGPLAYDYFITRTDNPAGMWFLFAAIGLATIVGLLLYNKFFAQRRDI